MLVGGLLGTSIHPIIKANEQINSPIVSGIPKKWTNDFDSCSAYYFGVDLKFTSLITSCYFSTKNNLYAYGVI